MSALAADRQATRSTTSRTTSIASSTPKDERFPRDAPIVTPSNESAFVMEYPDIASSNRREPYLKLGALELHAKHDARIFDVCGDFVCTSGQFTRVWSLLDGDNIMSLAHTEGLRVTSMSFMACSNVKDEGTRLWLGNNVGEIMEADISLQSIVTNRQVHARREVIKLYRYLDQMWSLDDGGTLHLWAPDDSGIPTLTNPSQTFRLPKGHTFSMVVDGILWHATGKDIRAFMPTLDASAQFQVLTRPLCQSNAGDVSAGATIDSQSTNIYFGHTDGKVSIYSTRDYTCLGIVSLSIYKVTSLAGVCGNLWAGFSTGMVYVYDTEKSPWVVKKDWRAHNDPLIRLVADRSSFWKLDRAQVLSLGSDNIIRVWDGLLQDDWIGTLFCLRRPLMLTLAENKMHSRESEYCILQTIRALVLTWNAGATTPYHLQHSTQDEIFFRELLQDSDSPEILVFGFQELVDLEDKKTTASMFSIVMH